MIHAADPFIRRKKYKLTDRPECTWPGCKQYARQSGGDYCRAHSGECACGNRTHEKSARCQTCANKHRSGPGRKVTYNPKTARGRLTCVQQIRELIQEYTEARDRLYFPDLCQRRINYLTKLLREYDPPRPVRT